MMGIGIVNTISCYGSYSGCPVEEKNVFYNQIFTLFATAIGNNILLPRGDLNGYGKECFVSSEDVHGDYVHSVRKKDRLHMLNFFETGHTFFHKNTGMFITYSYGEN